MKKNIPVFLIAFTALFSGSLQAQVPDQQNLRSPLEKLSYELEHTNLHLTNHFAGQNDSLDYFQNPPGEPDHKNPLTSEERPQTEFVKFLDRRSRKPGNLAAEYMEALRSEREARIAWLSGDYSAAEEHSVNSWMHLSHVNRIILEERTDLTEKMLRSLTAVIHSAKDPDAEFFLRKAYSELAQAKAFHRRAWNSDWNLYSMHYDLYKSGIQSDRISRRFFVLALIQTGLPVQEKPQHKKVSPSVFGQPNTYDFQDTARYLRLLIHRKLLNETLTFPSDAGPQKMISFTVYDLHSDNYGRFIQGRSNIQRLFYKKMNSSNEGVRILRPD